MSLMPNAELRRRSDFPGGDMLPNLCGGTPSPTAEQMLAWLQKQAEAGVVTMSFEFEGGMHVTLEPISGADPTRAARNVDSIQDGIALLMAENG